jgi:SAM-dependent methyltransferase
MRRIRDSTGEWQAIAQVPDLLYHIAGGEGMRGRWTEAQFYESGIVDWHEFRRHWCHYWPDLGGRCLEIGCGIGRLTRALANDFESVVAVDVSADMLDRARRVCPRNVDLRQVTDTRVPLADRSVNAVFSCHVLQHLDTFGAVTDYLAEAHRVLVLGGRIMVHLHMAGSGDSRRRRVRAEVDLFRSRRGLSRGRTHTAVRMRGYHIDQVHAMLAEVGFTHIEFRYFPVRSYHHAFWLARRTAG